MRMDKAVLVILALIAGSLSLVSCEDVEPSDSIYEDVPEVGKASPSFESAEPNPEGCGDGVCQPDETKCTCPKDCGGCSGDVSNITEFRCVDGKCKIMTKANVCGNGICDAGEFQSCPGDCPVCEPDNDPCTKDNYDYDQKACLHEPVIPCCGNGVCEPASEQDSCLVDCRSSNISLKDYPKPFVLDRQVNSLIVVGSNGAGASVAAGIDLIRGWVYNGSNAGYSTKAVLDTELDTISGKNVVLLGNACENRYVSQLMNPVRECHDGLEPGLAIIRLYKTGSDTYALVVAGYSGDETRKAAKILEKYQQYGISGFQTEVR